MKEHGAGCWSKLLPHFPGRIGKQLRERWNHELRPDINKQGWQPDEELALVAAHRTAGNCWADIAKASPQNVFPPVSFGVYSLGDSLHLLCSA